jgi:hypothetical protein
MAGYASLTQPAPTRAFVSIMHSGFLNGFMGTIDRLSLFNFSRRPATAADCIA